jgi:Big-like domain-containing protein
MDHLRPQALGRVRRVASLCAAAVSLIGAPAAHAAPAVISLTPTILNFSPSLRGATAQASSPMRVTVLNPRTGGSQAVTIEDFTSDPSDFIVRGRPHTTCARNQVLKPAQSCVIALSFVPSAVGLRSGLLTVSDSADAVSPTVQLSGLGEAALLTAEPPTANFGAVMVGRTKSIKLRLANKTPVFIGVTNVAAAEPFSAGSECRGMIRPGAICRLSVKFSPVAPADDPPGPALESGVLTFTETPQITQSVEMSGTAVVRRFGTVAPHARLPTGARCAQLVSASSWEPRPENGTANHTMPTAPELESFYAEPLFSGNVPASDFAPVDGNYSGTTDMMVRWAACKWGIDEDVLRAQAVNESNWTQSSNGDTRTDPSLCSAGTWNGWTGRFCNQSYGLMQIKVFDYNAWPEAWNSTSFNVDFRGAFQRACMNGDISYLVGQTAPGQPTYPNGTTDQMLWGCIGQWFSGGWYDSGATAYINDVRRLLTGKPWLGWWSGPTSVVSITSPADGATVSGIVAISVNVSPSVDFVNFNIDGSYAASSPPNGFEWDTTRSVLNGSHSVAVDAIESKGTMVGHAFVNVNVSN